MALKQTWGWKFRPELNYMTIAEQGHFKELVDAGFITIFKMGTCAGIALDVKTDKRSKCQNDIPENKTYCSIGCKERTEDSDEENV